MISVRLERPDDFDAWRDQARALVLRGVAPDQVHWSCVDAATDLFSGDAPGLARPVLTEVRVSSAFLQIAQSAALHRDPERHGLLYRLLWRLQEQSRLMDDTTDRDVRKAHDLAKAVRRDIHKMRAFVRFRRVEMDDGNSEEHYAAWFEPDHHIVRANAGFFVRRFAAMHWTIITPEARLVWDTRQLMEGPGGLKSEVPGDDAVEELWRDYYRSIFNPARLKVKAMIKEMPRRYWANMPETTLIPELIAGAQAREAAMIAVGKSSEEERPHTISDLQAGVSACKRCPLHADATRAVHGDGPVDARLMIVGEQPGDKEDLEGKPFVGPAGELLDRCLAQAGIDRSQAYVTNAVRHFKHERRGKVRLHRKPSAKEIDHCRWWLDAERDLVRPRVILALGTSAARGVLGRTGSVTQLRAQPIVLQDGTTVCVTVHPSYLLRIDDAQRTEATRRFIADLARCRDLVTAHA